ncbi:ABC transporter ATP-binding protein [Muribaculum intestinale]|uniref:ABC transporter ATP-binding protein n=1 Tax=Muribaculum intestinale TaxID=1796646 RepID=A0A4S2FJJ4_9BACT|nr:ABC transporter ATP-binding protein [Muribaculum intestinale]ROT06673.1 ABC transporter ATP-binding protein [Muribaculaceae bacterium Isolate-100 (HZI)]RXE66841.1 ABC transporter ATP-binding protein [Muribaculaceae bacterium Isolate-007 (NCI)]GFI66496.1 lipid A export ATP-binding/permease protein MsbA [Muribaculaceae bacterium]MDE5896039.1 ABC transporter ATP-binding protein/permease [Muribaculum intestinale]MYM12681.1 ATP-binding cassette domain-containing protein [Muribaculum intestinale]
MKELLIIIRRFVPPYKKYLALNIIFNILAAFLTLFSFAVVIPILRMLFGIDQMNYTHIAWENGSFKEVFFNNFYYYTQEMITTYGPSITLAALAALLVVMTGLKTGATFLSSYFIIPMRSGIVRDIRNYMYDKIVRLPISYFTDARKGDVMARMTGDVAEIENSIMSSLDMFFKNPVMIIACLTMMIIMSWQLTLFVLVLIPMAGLVMGRVGKRLKRQSLEAQNQWGLLMSNIEETLGGLRIIKAFNAEDKVKARFHAGNQVFYKISNRIARRQSLAHPMSEFLGTITIAIVLWFGGTLIIDHRSSMEAPDFIYYMIIFYSIINPAKELSKSVYAIQKGLAAMTRVDAIIEARNPIHDPAHPKKLADFKGDIRYNNISFSYTKDMPVIQDVSLHIPAGATVALVGQSGSGKSTMADLLPRFYDVDKGSITIDGTDIRDLRVHDLRSLMGNVNQEAILFNDTIYNNITFGVKEATRDQVEQAARIANAHEFIMETEQGYDTCIGDRGCRLSGGQRQRLSIARAVLKNPPVLILDEATSALDSQSEKSVQEALERLMKDRTTLVIAHRLSTIKNADLICVMNEGRIVESGTHDELMTIEGGAYRHLVDMQKF